MEFETNIKQIIQHIQNSTINGKVVGYGVGGSRQIGIVDAGSDVDLVVLMINKPKFDLSTELQFYDRAADHIYDCLIRNVDALNKEFKDTWIYGFGGWAWYLNSLWEKDKEQIEILDDRLNILLAFIYEHRNFFIHCMLVGYSMAMYRLASNINSLSLQESKGLYQLCYVYNKEIDNSITTEQLAAIKRGEFDKLTEAELTEIINKLEKLKEVYFIANLNTRTKLKNNIETGIASIWKQI